VRVRSHSFSELDRVCVRHLHLDIRPQFDRRKLQCVAVLDVQRTDAWPDAPIILDTERLDIREVSVSSNGGHYVPARFELGVTDKVLGQPLTILAPPAVTRVKIVYSTSSHASGLQWLEPNQTSSRILPFLFTQSQSIHARSWIPLQDTPAVRVTFSAVVHPPPRMMALMSAGNNQYSTHEGPYEFYMEHPVPPYLIALAVGRLDFAATSFRTGVYAEPSLIKQAEHEFSDTEKMIEAAERLYGPYRWGRYDLLVLPPSFPYGGMENPRLTFLTPTVITGDRSLIALIAHELAHSWAGNLVTNANWGDFWLNEGFTTYIEHRIQEEIYGRDRVEAEEVLSRLGLEEEMSKLEDRDQLLDIDLTGRDPDEAMTSIPYVKGALFLQSLEQTFGRARFDGFLRDYFDHFAFQSVTTAEAIQYLREKLLNSAAGRAAHLPVEDWLWKPGLPESAPKTEAKALRRIKDAASTWRDGRLALTAQQVAGWDTHQWLYFLSEIATGMTSERMSQMDAEFGLSRTTNSEILAQWLLLSVKNRYHEADPYVEEFLTSVGRLKYIKPIYEQLVTTSEGRRKALEIFDRARSFYHPIALTAIEQVFSRGVEPATLTVG
jgi:leukotriene-A4 hydrolase